MEVYNRIIIIIIIIENVYTGLKCFSIYNIYISKL